MKYIFSPNNTSNTYLEMERAPLRSSQSLPPHQNTARYKYELYRILDNY